MKRLLLIIAMFAAPASAAETGPPHAPNWIFRQSYYSHDPVTHVRIGTPYRPGGPYYTRPQGEYVRYGSRVIRGFIVAGPWTFDHVNYVESWIQTGAQY